MPSVNCFFPTWCERKQGFLRDEAALVQRKGQEEQWTWSHTTYTFFLTSWVIFVAAMNLNFEATADPRHHPLGHSETNPMHPFLAFRVERKKLLKHLQLEKEMFLTRVMNLMVTLSVCSFSVPSSFTVAKKVRLLQCTKVYTGHYRNQPHKHALF